MTPVETGTPGVPVVLASGSPRRRELLTGLGVPFTVQVSGEPEDSREADPARLAAELALRVLDREAETAARARQAAAVLIRRAEGGQSVLVFAHGYFNHMVGRCLKAAGWRLVHDQGFKYWSQRRYEKG